MPNQPNSDPKTVDPGQPPVATAGSEPPKSTVDPLTVKLDGDAVPEKFKGKTIADILESQKHAEAAMLTAQASAEQWRIFAEQKLTAAPAQKQEEVYDPYSDLDERTGKAVHTILQKTLEDAVKKVFSPIAEGVSAMQLEFVKATRPDFDQLEARAKQYFETMPLESRMNPAFGWDFAYRLAKAEQMGKPSLIPKTEPPPALGPSASPGGLPPAPKYDKDQLKYMEITGMSSENYEKYSQPQDPVGEAMKKAR